jgi:nicotinamide-nucleotide adenylyltransferase
MKALFIGRFQPFHNGHLNVLKNLSNKYGELIIGIGSSQYFNRNDNPFSAEERQLMINKTLQKAGITNYKIVLIPDLHDPPRWVNHVLSIYSDFDIVISNNEFTKQLFSEKGFIVKKTPFYNKNKFSGREIRKRIKNNEYWEDLVPKTVRNIINEINGVKRIKNI